VLFSLVTNALFILFVGVALAEWFDARLAWAALRTFDSLFSLANVALYFIASVWTAALRPAADGTPRALLMAASIVEALSTLISFVGVLSSDAVPRAVLSRRMQLAIFGVAVAICGWRWLQDGLLAASDAAGGGTEVCIIVCTSLQRVLGAAAFNVAVFAAKFFVSLSVWPRAAVILRARLYLE
jgi:hypothetical protein